jgi:acyl-CoA synthetase (NDP forming)
VSNGLHSLLHPESVAVVGASPHEGKVGNIIMKQLLGSNCRVYPVNARGDLVFGIQSYRKIAELPETPDLGVIALPAEATVAAVEECVARGVGAVIAVAGGFGETGEAGLALEMELKAAIQGGQTRLLGPNTLGVLIPRNGLDTIFIPQERFRRPTTGSIALISQSGSAVIGEMDVAAFYGVAFSAFVGLGNRLDVDENELLSYFAKDQSNSAIALYLESYADPMRFIDLCRQVTPHKPVVLLKAGRSEAGARAVQLHTGSLAGSDRVTDGILRQVGVHRAIDSEDLLDTARVLAYARPLKGRRVAILTSGGGWGIVLADYVESKDRGIGGYLAPLEPETERRLAKVALPFAALRNPIDLTASVTTDQAEAALEILQDDPGIDVILCSLGYQLQSLDDRITGVLSHWGRNGKKPLIVAATGSETSIQGLRELEAAQVPAFPTSWRAVRAIDALARRGEYLQRLESKERTKQIVKPERKKNIRLETPLSEDQVKALLREHGLLTPRSIVLPRGELPLDIPLSYPLVAKVLSASILHKIERKGVVLNIQDWAHLEGVAQEMRARFPGEDLLLEEMEPKGIEVIVGLVDDPTFGLSIMCGVGGVLAELYRDVAFRGLPIGRSDAEEMLSELKGAALLKGFRGIEASREAVIDLLLKVSALGEELSGQIDQMDLNPVIVHRDRAVVVDAKLILNKE